MTESAASGIGCPQCGGSLEFREGAFTTLCGSCKTPFVVSGVSGISRFFLEERLDLAQARTAVRKFLDTRGVAASVVSRLRFEGGKLCFLPFWRFRAQAVGWQWSERETVVVEEIVDEQGVTRKQEQKGPLERDCAILALPVDYSSPACDLSPYGLTGIATVSAVLTLRGVEYERLSRKGTIFDPIKEPEQVRREAVAQSRDRARKSGTLRHESEITLCGERLALIYYPVWQLGFTQDDRLHPVMVDGVNGRILKARFAGMPQIRLRAPLVTITVLAYAFLFHLATGIVATGVFLAWCASRGELSFSGLAGYFFHLVVPGEEITHD